MSVTIEVEMHHRPVVDSPVSRRVERGDTLPIASFPRLLEAIPRPRRGVRNTGRSRFPGQLVEAGERLGLAVGVEILDARQQAIGSEDLEEEVLPLIRAAAGAGDAKVSPAQEERISLQ